jgi:hypothetical protein
LGITHQPSESYWWKKTQLHQSWHGKARIIAQEWNMLFLEAKFSTLFSTFLSQYRIINIASMAATYHISGHELVTNERSDDLHTLVLAETGSLECG